MPETVTEEAVGVDIGPGGGHPDEGDQLDDSSVTDLTGSGVDTDEQPVAEEAKGAQDKGQESGQEEKPDLSDKIAELAKQYGLDAKDESTRSILETIAAKDAGISDEPNFDALDELMASFDKEPEGKGTETKEAPKTATASPAADPGPLQFGDGYDHWKSLSEAQGDLASALDRMSIAAETELPHARQQVAAINNAIFARQFMGMGVPVMHRMVSAQIESILSEKFSALTPLIDRLNSRETAERASEDAERMLNEKLGTDFAEMLAEDGGEPVVVNGKKFDPIPYNRILRENPYISEIQAKDADPQKAALKTALARYGAAYRIFAKEKQVKGRSAKAASALVKAGAASTKTTPADRTRQGLGAGSKTSATLNGKTKPGEQDDLTPEVIQQLSQGNWHNRLFK